MKPRVNGWATNCYLKYHKFYTGYRSGFGGCAVHLGCRTRFEWVQNERIDFINLASLSAHARIVNRIK